jgi:hypothetical protein
MHPNMAFSMTKLGVDKKIQAKMWIFKQNEALQFLECECEDPSK